MNFFLIEEWGSTDTHTEKTSELERTNRLKTINDETSSKQGEYSGITVEKSYQSPRKRRTVRQLTDEDISTREKRRNYDLEVSVKTLALEPQGSTSETEKQKDNLRQYQTSPRPSSSNISLEKGLVQRQQEAGEELKQATCQTKDIAETKSPSSDISTTSKQSNPIQNLFLSVFKWPNLYDQDDDGDT